jgi:CobQ-like glutamine amidotransferase family enzyme
MVIAAAAPEQARRESEPGRPRLADATIELSAVQSREALAEAAQPGAVRLGAAQPGAVRLGAAQPGAVRLGAAQPGAVRLGAAQPGAAPGGSSSGAAPASGVSSSGADAKGASAERSPSEAAGEWLARAPAASRGGSGPSRLRLVWVYPDLLSTYGDRGNLLVLERRARLRGIEISSFEVKSDQSVPRLGDIYLMGGGEDLPQILAARRLRADGGLTAAAERGAVLFAVCAGYQVLGAEFGGVDGEPVAGLGILDVRSGRGERRSVGEIVADAVPGLGVPRLTGFENHQGVTHLGPGARPLARVRLGTGNGDGTEGAYAGKVLGTYLHGPALVRNPGLADLLLAWATGPVEPLGGADEDWVRRLREERLAATASSPAQ